MPVKKTAKSRPANAKKQPSRRKAKKRKPEPLPPEYDWRTTDTDEVLKRKRRAKEERMQIKLMDTVHPVFADFQVTSPSGLDYTVEIRGFEDNQASCSCQDFRQNGLGTCKHVEATKNYLNRRQRKIIRETAQLGSPRIDIVLDREADAIRLERNRMALPPRLRRLFAPDSGFLKDDEDPRGAIESLSKAKLQNAPRISIEIEPWLQSRESHSESLKLRRDYESKVRSGAYPLNETTVPLYPYQREGMLHLAFTRRALLADEMGLGKTIQAIAASALLQRLGKAQRVLIIAPASLKAEWEEQIQKFTTLSSKIVYGNPKRRVRDYERDGAAFFTIINYEQARVDTLNINHYLRPDVVILDEAQRIKNWASLTARAVKRLESPYAFVLSGTPIENRIDELYSIIDYLDPQVLGPLFRFNRSYYTFDERGRPNGYQNLRELHERIAPLMMRRRKAQVETELPDRTDRNLFVELSSEQKEAYGYHAEQVIRLMGMAKRRPLKHEQQEKLMRELAMTRMICDTNYILNPEQRACPKLKELMATLDDCLSDPDVKVVVFSEWVRMLELVEEALNKANIGFALHTGKVSQQKRRVEIQAFKEDPKCRVLLCTESGGAGLNLQVASVVINLDLPWNPAKFEQRVARAWRKHQKRPVTVVNLISANTIEHGMLSTLDAKRSLSDGVLDLAGDLSAIAFKTGGQNFLKRLEQTLSAVLPSEQSRKIEMLPPAAKRPDAFAQRCQQLLGDAFVSCEESFPEDAAGSSLIVVVERDAASWIPRLEEVREGLFGKGKWSDEEPVCLQAIDRSTAIALEQLQAAGLIQTTTRIRRLLASKEEIASAIEDAFTAEERKRIDEIATAQKRRLQASRLLLENGFSEMALPVIEEIRLLAARRVAVENHLPEPTDWAMANGPPLNRLLPESLSKPLTDSGDSRGMIRFLDTLDH